MQRNEAEKEKPLHEAVARANGEGHGSSAQARAKSTSPQPLQHFCDSDREIHDLPHCFVRHGRFCDDFEDRFSTTLKEVGFPRLVNTETATRQMANVAFLD